MQLSGRTAIVTGSTSGIGLGIAPAFAKAGANVVVNGLGSEEDNEKAIREVAASARAWPSIPATCCGTTRSRR